MRWAALTTALVLLAAAARAQQYTTVNYVITRTLLTQQEVTNWVRAQNYCTSCNLAVATNGTLVGYAYTPTTISTNGTVVGTL